MKRGRIRGLRPWWPILIVTLLLALAAPWMASTHPDGLEFVAERLGFARRASAPLLPAPLPDYALPGREASRPFSALAGILGTGAVFGLAYGAGRALTRRRRTP